MKIQVLIDNIAGTCGSRKLFGEWGLSVYVEFEDKRYLLDRDGRGPLESQRGRLESRAF